jgi:endoglucanase
MRIRLVSLLALMLVITTASAQETAAAPLAPPEITGQALYIPFPVDITLDGDLSDWAGVPSATVERGTMPSTNPAENGSFTFSVAADMDTLYISMSMPDQNIITGQHGQDYWNEDSLEFYVNFSGDLGATTYGDGIHQFNINPGNIGNTDPAALVYTGVNAAGVALEGYVFETDDGWGFEVALPLPVEPEHGLEIGFNAHANGASVQDRDVKLIWSLADSADTSWQNPSVFGRALFFEIGREDIPEMSVIVEETPQPDLTRAITAVNQVGYFVDGPKRAVHGSGAELDAPPAWELRDSSETVVASGQTLPGFFDEASGDYVYLADFSAVNETGTYTIAINGVQSAPFSISDSIYAQLRIDALHYYYQNRSGIVLEAQYAGEAWAREAGHPTDNDVTCWSGQDTAGNPWEGCDYRLDASGGWYDAGDYGKYVVNGGISVWTLLNWYERSPESFPDGSLPIPENDNGVPDILDEARWEMDFLLRMQVPEGEPLAGMAHHKMHDVVWAGLPEMPVQTAPNDDPDDGRFLMPPSTAATLNLAATAAQCARIYRAFDAEFADRCLVAAERAWQAALEHPDLLYGSIPGQGGGDYGDGNVTDEFFWAAAELFVTTGADEYRDFLAESPYFTSTPTLLEGAAAAMYWGDTAPLGLISLATVPSALTDVEVQRIREMIIAGADNFAAISEREGYGVPFGVNHYYWGSNSNALNNAIIMALAYDFTGDERYLNGVIETANYILGRNAVDQSFVSGYGLRSMQHPHHRFWANQGDYPPPPPGALAGGPNGSPADPYAIENVSDLPTARRYVDHVDSYSTNEVTINWNAPLMWVSSYLDETFNE